ncbi:hypothetical protein Hanom_Chr07g00664821 [Helianthus anomalus]
MLFYLPIIKTLNPTIISSILQVTCTYLTLIPNSSRCKSPANTQWWKKKQQWCNVNAGKKLKL